MKKAAYIEASTVAEESLRKIGLVKGAVWNREDEEHHRLLCDYSSVSVFSDDKWFIDKKESWMNHPDAVRRIRFDGIDRDVKDWVKEWTIEQLLSGRKLKGIQSSLSDIKNCLQLVPGKGADELDRRDILKIYDVLFSGKKSTTASVSKWNNLKNSFADTDCTEQQAMMAGYNIPCQRRKKSKEKLIPEAAVKQLDIVFKSERIPLTYRCIYWTLRLIPNRIEEVCSIIPTALKQIANDRYLLTIPINKTGGNFDEPEEKYYEIIYSGMGKYYVDLLREQVEFTKNNLPDAKFLFVSKKVCYMRNLETGQYEYRETGKKLYSVHDRMCIAFFGKLGKRLDIRDENGKVINVTTHKFRHNGTTERSWSGIFRNIDIMYLTGHKNTAMIDQNYSHPKKKEIKSGFRGHIGDERRAAMILKRPYAKDIYHLGVCTDSRECRNERFVCLTCDHVRIENDMIPFMIRDYHDWKKKRQRAETIGEDRFEEYCSKWIEAYSKCFLKLGMKKEDYDGS